MYLVSNKVSVSGRIFTYYFIRVLLLVNSVAINYGITDEDDEQVKRGDLKHLVSLVMVY